MSHLTSITTQIISVQALQEACKALGLTLVEGGTVRDFFEAISSVDYHVSIPGSKYAVGFQKQPDNTFTIISDQDMLQDTPLGPNYARLKQEYSFAVIQRQAVQKGLYVSRQSLPNAEILVTLTALTF